MQRYNFIWYSANINLLALLLALLVLELIRYSSLDINLKTNNAHLSYQIDLLDIPESYTDNLNEQIGKLQRIYRLMAD